MAITANTTYVVSYHTNAGHYAFTSNGLASAVTNGPLTALASGGVYAYGSANAFPSNTFNASNYWVDVVYTQTAGATPPTVTTVTPTAGSTGNPVSVAPTATFSQAVVPNTVSFTLQGLGRERGRGRGELQHRQHGGDVHADELAGGEHHLHRDGVGGAECLRHADEQPLHLELHHRCGRRQCPCSVWQNAAPSGAVDAADTSAVNLGVQFQASSSGKITGVRFYKYSDNTGTHTGSLWTSSGTLLATGTFSNETASGWQELDFSTPVTITAGHHLCGLLPHQRRALRVHVERAVLGGDERAADGAGQRRRLRLRLGERLPVE